MRGKSCNGLVFVLVFLITACVKVYVTMSANFCLANFVDVLFCQILFRVFECKLYVLGMRDFFAMGYLFRFIDNRVWWKMKIWNHFLTNKWLYSFALVDPLSLNLHLRFYTMVDRKFEQHLVLYDKLFIYLYKWLLPFDWMMNELNLCNITYIYDIQYATLMPKGTIV